MSDDHVLIPGHAPTPFTAEEIRRGCPEGRTVITRTVSPEGTTTSTSRFTRCDEEGTTLVGGNGAHRVSWVDLQRHASFPADVTTIDEERITTPLGSLDCLRYQVTADDEVSTFWFAKSLPGMPVLYTSASGGRLISTTTMVSNLFG
jgi:hypothetical protein